ncbi:MAG TPA: EAL domain-containing protein, partial [Acidimicrobiales bacterium]|nr:EAL domain-containing protein [Acidimicrobiales bacterium]
RLSLEQSIGTRAFKYLHPDDAKLATRAFIDLARTPGASVRDLVRVVTDDGEVRDLEIVLTNCLDNHDVAGIILNGRDITEERALAEQLSRQALHDPLTGLANRVLFEDRLEKAHARAVLRGGVGAVFMLDLDDFKGINDVHGHLVGDQLLLAITDRLQQALSPSDTLGRFGGDEFLCLVEDLTSPGEVAAIAKRLLDVFAEPFVVSGVQVEQHVSIGIVVWDGSREDPDEITRDADVALYEAKRQGKGRFAIFTRTMHQEAVSRFALVQDLHVALQCGELSMHYQPIMHLLTNQVVGFEALMRWQHPGRGWVPPSVFIPLAEQSGLILELDAFALREAVGAAASWRPTEPHGVPPFVTVNLSAHQFREPKMVSMIEDVLMTSGLEPRRLVIEITEGVLLRDASEATNVITRLQERGVSFALDDFGTGYSSLSYLAELHPRVIKIDQSFVRPSTPSPRSDALLETIITLGDKLEITMLAEGIETAAQLQRLRLLGCELGQGYFYSPAVSSDQLTALLARTSQEWEHQLISSVTFP